MNEATWLTGEEPKPYAEYLFGRASPRKLRLWACACGRELLPHFSNPRIGEILTAFESVAEGETQREDQARLFKEFMWSTEEDQSVGYSKAVAGISHSQWIKMTIDYEGHFSLGLLFQAFAQAYSAHPHAQPAGPTDPPLDPAWQLVYFAAKQKQSALARDIFGNPFRPFELDPLWQTTVVLTLARSIYETRDFLRLPNLAAALAEAGCDNQEIINHCREPGPHVLGCWVLDSLLGKS